MRTRTIRLIVLIGTVSIAGIMFMQVVWFKKAFDLKQRQFEHTVFLALQNVAETILEYKKVQVPMDGLVNQISSNYFAVNINGEIETSLLEFLLKTEFKKRNITAAFEYGVYNCETGKMVFGNNFSENIENTSQYHGSLPVWNKDKYFFSVYFPGISMHVVGELRIWLLFNFVLLLVCIFFGFTLFIILKQKRLSEVQKDFINNMTHEFKTPISTILVSANLISKPEIAANNEHIIDYTTIISREALRLKSHVDKVLQIATLDMKKVHYDFSVVDLHDLISQVAATIGICFLEKPGKIELILASSSSSIKADREHITNVLSGLLDNAIKYCFEQPEIVIETETDGQNIFVTIKDNGIGINKDHLKRVFDKFYREPTGNIHQTKGFGLGLFYAKTVIERHRGKIELKSLKNKGTAVTICLPLLKK